jgi:peptidoglycan hydrolase CwlO-like protein
MARFGYAICLASALRVFASDLAVKVTPIEKVISLLEGMKKEVEDEGKAEATSYDKFACFCKDTTKTKSDSVTKGNDKIDVLSADIADKTQSKVKDSTELGERKTKQEELSAELASTVARCAKEKAEYEVSEADLSKAISSLKKAIKAMKDSKPSAASFLQGSIREDLDETLAMADALNLIAAPKRKAVSAMIQNSVAVDPSDPEYEYHSGDIIKLLESLESDFKDQKTTLDGEYAKTKKACDDLKASLKKEMGANTDAMKALEKNIDKLSKEIANDREDLVKAEDQMKDDEQYLKDLTARCEVRAQDWDQRSAMRNDEISALTEALKILSDDVKGAADKVNVRALLVQKRNAPPVTDAKKDGTKKAQEVVQPVKKPVAQPVKKPVSFLQAVQQHGNAKTFLMRSGLSQDALKDKALATIASEGQRLGSVLLTSFATRSAADPFKKVKGLIQKLIERLLEESRAEATKKGFCDTELGKARKERDFRFEDIQDLSTDLERLEAKRDELTQEIKQLTEELKDHNKALKATIEERKESKEENLATIKTAKEGYEAVQEALLVLKSFYKQAAKAAFIQASPVDEDTQGAGFSGSYKGKQGSSNAVLALLETISADFDRTLRKTTQAEEAAHRDFVKFEQTIKSSIGSKTTQKNLDEQDLATTKISLKTKMEDLVSAQKLLDGALKEIEELKPTCIDSGMSYKERVEKREEEMEALKKALCILDEDKVEPECK